MARVVVIIFHPRPEPGAGALTQVLAAIRDDNARRHAAAFERIGARVEVSDEASDRSFGERLRAIAARLMPAGLVVLGSGSVPLATDADRRAFLAAAGGPAGRALANNRYSADIVALAGADRLADLPDLASDNGLPRWLAGQGGFDVDDLAGRWRLQVDLDSPLDGLLIRRADATARLRRAGIATDAIRSALAGVAAAARDRACELFVAGRASAAGLRWLERSTASRTRALIEERGFRTRTDDQRPVRSTLGLILDRDGPEAIGPRLAELGDAAVIDSRVLVAHRFGADERSWPSPEDRFASDLLLPERIADPWLRALTSSARDSAIPVVLGGHSLVGPGLRLVFARGASWT